MNVLVDTTIWSLALRKKKKSQLELGLVNSLRELIDEGRAKIIGPIRQEVLSGISLPRDYQKLKENLSAYEDIQLEIQDYERGAEMFSLCRKNGIQGSHIDFLICAVAENHHLSIFTLDKDFSRYAEYLPILLFNFAKE